jgi:hypothetical protein
MRICNVDAEREHKTEAVLKKKVRFNGDYDVRAAYFSPASLASSSAR